MEEEVISLKDLWRAIKRGYRLIIGGAILGCVLALVISVTVIKPKYSETASVKSDVPVSEVLINTYTKFAKSDDYLQSVSNELKKEKIDLSSTQLANMLEFTWTINTQVMDFKVTSDEQNAGKIANAMAEQFSKLAVDELPDNVFYAYPEVANQTITDVNEILMNNVSSKYSGEEYIALRTIVDDQVRVSLTDTFDKLTKNMMKNKNFKVITKAQSNVTKSFSKILMHLIIGMVIGAVTGTAFILFIQMTSGSISDTDYIQDKFGLTNLGVISDK